MDVRIPLSKNMVLDESYRVERVIGAGGFGITYEAEDVKLRTRVALKEYYPEEFGARDAAMSVRPMSEIHHKTFEWGRSSFLKEAQTLARFRHPSIVRVSRVFEAHSTAYMVMDFEEGPTFEAWLKNLGRAAKQDELDRITAPLLDALEMMHVVNILHRDIAPDNIIVRADATPVLLDFGAARRAAAEKSRTLMGVVKAGYSPHEQYASDNRLQGPWSDLYAFGATLYRGVTGKPPEEATLRVIDDRMVPAAAAAKGSYRPGFLSAIDACLELRPSERPQSVGRLRPMLLGAEERKTDTSRLGATRHIDLPQSTLAATIEKRRLAIAATLAVIAGIFGGFEYTRSSAEENRSFEVEARPPSAAAPSLSPAASLPPAAGGRAWLGVKIQTIDADTASRLGLSEAKGVLLVEVTTPGPGAAAGLKSGDAILAINGSAVIDAQDFTQRVQGYSPNARVDVLIRRGQQEQTITAYLGTLPAQSAEAKSCATESGDVAIESCSELIQRNPTDEIAYINRGKAHGIKGELDRAIADFSKAIEINPRRAISFSNRGVAYQSKRQNDRAIADYNKAIELDPKLASVYYNRGAAYQMKGNRRRATADYRTALEIDPRQTQAAANLKSLGAKP